MEKATHLAGETEQMSNLTLEIVTEFAGRDIEIVQGMAVTGLSLADAKVLLEKLPAAIAAVEDAFDANAPYAQLLARWEENERLSKDGMFDNGEDDPTRKIRGPRQEGA